MAELDPTVQGIVDKLSPALQDLQAVDEELEGKSGEVAEVVGQMAELDRSHEESGARITAEHARAVFESYDRNLRDVIRRSFTDEKDILAEVPPLEACQQIAEIDAVIRAAAGQPVVVIKPGKNWVDVGILESRTGSDLPDEHRIGLQASYGGAKLGGGIVLPVHEAVAIDVSTGQEPSWDDKRDDEELNDRGRLRLGGDRERARTHIDPLHTRVLLGADAVGSEEGEGITHVLIGYGYLQHTLNRIYGFNFEELNGSEDLEDYARFQALVKLQETLAQAGIAFDTDYIDGCLDYRIDKLKAEMEGEGLAPGSGSPYRESVLTGMQQKLVRLKDEGWLSS